MTKLNYRRSLAMVGALGFLLSGCCGKGEWCFSPVQGPKAQGVPPAANNDDRTSGVDPRTAH